MNNRIRLSNWSSNVNNTIDAWRYKNFTWGKYDCLHLIYDIEKSIYGHSLISAIADEEYADKDQALKMCKKYGYQNWIEIIKSLYTQIDKRLATLGDIGLAKYDGVYSCAVCVGVKYAAMSDSGMVFFGAEHIKRSWRI